MMICRHCEEPILPEEVVPTAKDLHRECAFRMVSGSADHILRGPHEPGTCLPDDPKLTRREAARAALAAWEAVHDADEVGGVM